MSRATRMIEVRVVHFFLLFEAHIMARMVAGRPKRTISPEARGRGVRPSVG